jgi:hypothetical protein
MANPNITNLATATMHGLDDQPASPATSIGALRKRLKYNLGWPQVKLEVDQDQIDESINYAIKWYHRYAQGTATKRRYLLFELIPYQQYYQLPAEVYYVTDYSLDTSVTGINTLFTLENWLWNYGFLNFFDIQRGQFTLLNYHLTMDYVETLRRYITGEYKFEYNEWDRRLQIQPEPDSTEVAMIECVIKVDDEYLYDALWVEDYATQKVKYKIGEIRSKYSGATLAGTQAQLNGESMKQEAQTEIERLEERLRNEEAEGWPVMVG